MNLASVKLSTWLKENTVTQRDFASRIGVKPPAVTRYLQGRVPEIEIVKRIKAMTGIAFEDWITEVSDEIVI